MNFIKPTPGLITSFFNPNRKNPVTGIYRPHSGVDIGWVDVNNDKVVAAAAGKVVVPAYSSLAGNYVWIEHGNGYTTVYSHLRSIHVKTGQYVKQGQVIGIKGTTGNSTGVHLHFEVIQHHTFSNSWAHKRNPLLYFVDPTTKEWQAWLKGAGYYKGSVDGIYGDGTTRAVLQYQKKYGLMADGVCGGGTYNHMKKTIGHHIPPTAPTPPKEGGLTEVQYKEIDKRLKSLEEAVEKGQSLRDVQRGDLKELFSKAYKDGLFSVDHTADVDTMTAHRATELLISFVNRMYRKEEE